MSAQVTALLVVHNEPANALRALAAINSQTYKPDRIVVVDSSIDKAALPLESVPVAPKTKLGAIVRAGLEGTSSSPHHWFWLVHDDSEPQTTALAELVAATENSESVVQVGPLQLSTERTREITQLGLTISRFGELINPIKGQRDQAQHDQVKDVLAVSTSGMLVRTDAYDLVGGLDDRSATLAADVDLSIRFRRHGFQVVTAPRAKVLHSNLTLSGKRGRRWLGGSVRTALRKATIQLRLTHDPLPLAFLYWLALPLITVYRVFWRLAQKRPSFLWSELRAGTWGFFTVFKRFASRSKAGKLPMKSLAPLRASWAEVSKHNRQALEAEESAQSLAAFERGDHEVEAAEKVKSFTQSAGWLLVGALLALSWQQLPLRSAVDGGSAIPLSNDWFAIFARTGASWQPIGQGFVAPSDPFNWVLLTLSSLTFWAPNLSLVVLLWIARALAFASAWRALSLITAKAWPRNLGALCYALLPAFTASISAGEYPAILATILSPWLVFAIARAAGLGRSGSARSDARTWSWIGLAGVLLAAVGAAAPPLIILTLLGLALVAFTKIRRFGYLFWIPLPLAAIYLPLAVYEVITLGKPLALFAEPTVGITYKTSALAAMFTLGEWTNWGLLVILMLALFALVTKRWIVSLAMASFGLIAFALSQFVQSLQFPESTYSSGRAVSAVIGLTVIGLAIHFASALRARLALAAVALTITLAVSPLVWLTLTTQNQTSSSEGSVVPLLLQKQAEQGTDLQILEINQNDDAYRVNWLPVAGVHLEDSNLAYRFSGTDTAKSATYQELAQSVGDLVSANGVADASVLQRNNIGYILVPNVRENSGLVASLESSVLLESAGLTPFGELWRVKGISASDLPKTDRNPWSITKVVQLATLLGFALLAIPARVRTKRPTDSTIFIDQIESELDV
ncbi:MAG: hypothetical protein RL166_83 [Actinomycetota bacterium]